MQNDSFTNILRLANDSIYKRSKELQIFSITHNRKKVPGILFFMWRPVAYVNSLIARGNLHSFNFIIILQVSKIIQDNIH